jgi:DnaK suppressor protein
MPGSRDHATTPSSPDAAATLAASLQLELEHARAKFARVEAEYAQLLADPDTIQEDRDSVRQLLEELRAASDSAERAVARLAAGEYGQCSACGGDIGAERLEAIPDTATCRDCS